MKPRIIENAWGGGGDAVKRDTDNYLTDDEELFKGEPLVRKLDLPNIGVITFSSIRFLTDGKHLICRSFIGETQVEELVVVDLASLSSSHFGLTKVPRLDFKHVILAAYCKGFMAVKTYFAFNRPSDIGPFQCFEFDTGDVKQVSWPDFPESESITAICASEGWVCTAIGSFEDPKILVWDRKSKQTIATLLDQHCDRTNNGYKYYSDIVIRGTTLAGTTHNGRVVLWDTFTIDQADPSRSFNTRRDMWSKSGVETILLTARSAFILNRLHRTAAAVIFDNEIHQVTEWDDPWVSEPSHTNKYRWVSRDFSFKAEGYEIEPRTGSFATADYRSTSVPRIDIFKVGQPKPFVGLNPIKKSVVDLGSFFTAIIDKNCITMVGSDGIVQITFGAGGEHKLGCSGYISTSQAINGFDTSTKMLFQTYKHRLKDIHGWE